VTIDYSKDTECIDHATSTHTSNFREFHADLRGR